MAPHQLNGKPVGGRMLWSMHTALWSMHTARCTRLHQKSDDLARRKAAERHLFGRKKEVEHDRHSRGYASRLHPRI
jgi:hypothetical protein